MPSIAEADREVQVVVQRAIALARSSSGRTLAEVERELWSLMLEVGRALIVLFLAAQSARPRAARYVFAGVEFAIDASQLRRTVVGTRFGRVPFVRPVGVVVGDARAAKDLPIDRELDLCGSFSLGTVMLMSRLCAQLAFGTARETFSQFHEWAPSSRAVLRMVDAAGSEAKTFLMQAPAPEGDGEILVIQVDAKGAPMITGKERKLRSRPRSMRKGTRRAASRERRQARPRPRRTKGKKSKNAKMAVVGVIYTLRMTPAGLEGPVNKRLYATFESHEALFIWLRHEADKRGYGSKRTLFLADGSEHIWRCQKKYFANAETAIDWFHVVEKLWIAGKCLHKEGSSALRQWIAGHTKLLRGGQAGSVIALLQRALAAVPKTGPGNRGRRKRLGEVIAYFDTHRDRMRYDELRRDGLDIGTGAAEGAVRNLVGIRLDGPGMRWGRGRSELVLHLRCVLLNGAWEAFVRYVAAHGVVYPSQPQPAITHDAKPQKVAA